MTNLERYYTDILDKRIVSCEKKRKLAEKILDWYVNPGEYHYDYDLGKKPIEFIEKFCRVPTGKIGTPLKLELFQKARLEVIFGFVDDNDCRKHQEVFIVEGRKNGKTTETSAIELYMLIADNEGSPQIYNVATKLDQAKLGFNACHKMIKQSPLLNKHIRKRASDLYFSSNLGYIKAIASDTSSMDGLDAHMVTIDELAAIKNRDIYDLMRQSMQSRSQPLLFTISTNGFLRNGIFDAQYDYASKWLDGSIKNDRFIPFINELDSVDEWDNPSMWIKANPGIDSIKKRAFLENSVQKAIDDPSYKPTVLVKDFNLKQTNESRWLKWEELNNEETFRIDKSFGYAIGAFDAADKIDLNAAHAIFTKKDDKKIYVKSMYWLPENVLKENGNRKERDNAPYRLWVDQGYLRVCEGGRCDKRIFLEWFKELREEEEIYTLFIGYDPWHIDDTLLREFSAEFGKNAMIPVRQGAKSLSVPMKDLKAELIDGNIVYDNNPITKWCLYNTEIKSDINGNIQPVKSVHTSQRIDGTVAMIIGYKILSDKKNEVQNLNS